MEESSFVGSVSILLTKEEVETVIEALKNWSDSVERDGFTLGMFLSSMVSRDVEGESEAGEKLRGMINEQAAEESRRRQRLVYRILAKIA